MSYPQVVHRGEGRPPPSLMLRFGGVAVRPNGAVTPGQNQAVVFHQLKRELAIFIDLRTGFEKECVRKMNMDRFITLVWPFSGDCEFPELGVHPHTCLVLCLYMGFQASWKPI